MPLNERLNVNRRALETELSKALDLDGHVELRDAWQNHPDPSKIVVSPLESLPTHVIEASSGKTASAAYVRSIISAREAMVELSVNGVRELVSKDLADAVMQLAHKLQSV